MRLLLDTHILLWAMVNDRRLSQEAANLIKDPHNIVLVSAASFWEIAIKTSLNKVSISLLALAQAMTESGFETLSINVDHCLQLARLPLLHRDPFDRMLVAQSRAEPAMLVTSDKALAEYGETVLLV